MHGIGATDLQVTHLFQRKIAIDAFIGSIAGASRRGRGSAAAGRRRGLCRGADRRRDAWAVTDLIDPCLASARAYRARHLGCPDGGAAGTARGLMISRARRAPAAALRARLRPVRLHARQAGARRCASATDAAVVLTGGPGRIEHAIDVLRPGKAKRLLVAGVDPSVTKADLARRIPGSAKWLDMLRRSRQRIGRHALQCGRGGRWLAKHNFDSLRLITSDWHMRRARYEFEKVLGRKYQLVTDAVRTEPSFLTLFGEYNKYLLRRRRGLGRPLMALLRSLLYAAIFYPATVTLGPGGHRRELFGRRSDARGGAELGRAPSLADASMSSAFACASKATFRRAASDRGQAPVDVRDARDGAPRAICRSS